MLSREEIIATYALNLERERDRLKLTQSEMAEKLDISHSSYKRLVNGSTNSIDIYTEYKVYNLTGKMTFDLCEISGDTFNVIRKINKLSPNQLRSIEAMIDFELQFTNDMVSNEENEDDYITVYIPTGNMQDGMIFDSANYEKIKAPQYKKRYGNALTCGIRVTSNHLHPVYHKGDILLITRTPIRDGDTGLFINKEDGCGYIRKFHQTVPTVLEPINGYGQTFTVDSNDNEDMSKWIKFGHILTKIHE